jgi:hypothetical protein
MYISLRGARATGLCQIGKSSAPGIKQNAKAVQIMLLQLSGVRDGKYWRQKKEKKLMFD